jgi:hypothetical protein
MTWWKVLLLVLAGIGIGLALGWALIVGSFKGMSR